MNKEYVSASNLIDEMQEHAASEIQAFKSAHSKTAELRVKQKEQVQRINELKEELREVFGNNADVDAAIKRRHDIQNEISEREEILAGIDRHFLPAAEASEGDAASKVVGIFLSIATSRKKDRQLELNSLFDQAHLVIANFNRDISKALIALFGMDWHKFIGSGTKINLQTLDLSKSPNNGDDFRLGMLARQQR